MPSIPAAPRLRLTAFNARRKFSSAATCSIRSSCIAFCRESRLALPSGPPVAARRGSTASASDLLPCLVAPTGEDLSARDSGPPLGGYSGFLVGRCELGCRIPFPSPSYDSRSVLAVKGSLRRVKRAPLTAPGRSEAHNLYEGKGIRGTSHLSTISASAPQSAFHRSTVLKCGRLLARSWPVPPTRNPEEPFGLAESRSSSFCSLVLPPFAPAALPAFLATMASADFPSALTEELSPGKTLILSLHTVRLYFVRLVWISGFTVASTLTARTRPLCRFVFLRSKVCFPLPSAWPRGLRPTTSALRFPTVTSIGPGRIVSSCENQPMPGTLAHAFSVPCRHSCRHVLSHPAGTRKDEKRRPVRYNLSMMRTGGDYGKATEGVPQDKQSRIARPRGFRNNVHFFRKSC